MLTGTGSTFDTAGYANFGQFFTNEGQDLVASNLNISYGLYVLFTTTGGDFSVDLAGNNTFLGGTGAVSIYIDKNMDGTFGFGADPLDLVVGNNSDDVLLATSTTLTQQIGLLVPGVGGFFDLIFDDFTLTDPAGTNYFFDPTDFYLRTNVDGDFDTFDPNDIPATLTGDVSAVFVPEPSALALVGIALLGVGMNRRKKS